MSLFDELLQDIEIPRFQRIAAAFDPQRVEDIEGEVFGALEGRGARRRIGPGDRVCVAAGSRDIGDHARIVKAVVDYVKDCGGDPFIIPAMGSHGGATASGQAEILEGFGITRERMGAPILSTMETVEIARTASGLSVQMDRYANEADFIIPVSRIKPHTDFRGKVESGMCKMLTIGLGKQHGAYISHRRGFEHMAETVWEVAGAVAERKKNIMVLGIVENACHQACRIVAVPGERVRDEEPPLLELAKRRIARLPFSEADVLIVDEFGKDISGAGMDPNVTGRSPKLPPSAPFFKNIVVRDLTCNTHGNCGGIGNADVITRRVFDQFSFEASYPNAITAADARGTMIPIVMPNDRLAIKFAIRASLPYMRDENPRVVWIKNTLSLSDYWISEALVPDARALDGVSVADGPLKRVRFDDQGNACGWES